MLASDVKLHKHLPSQIVIYFHVTQTFGMNYKPGYVYRISRGYLLVGSSIIFFFQIPFILGTDPGERGEGLTLITNSNDASMYHNKY